MADNQPVLPGPREDSADKEPPMIGDFDGSANPLWNLYGKEAKSHDESRIQTLKDDMNGVLIFVCSCFICSYNYELDHANASYHRPVYILLLSLHS